MRFDCLPHPESELRSADYTDYADSKRVWQVNRRNFPMPILQACPRHVTCEICAICGLFLLRDLGLNPNSAFITSGLCVLVPLCETTLRSPPSQNEKRR